MRDKGRTWGIFKVYLQWSFSLSVLSIMLTAVVTAIPIKAGIIVSVFTIVYIGIVLWLHFSRERDILVGFIAFPPAYGQSRQNLLEEILMPYAVADGSGHLLWMNREFMAILEEDKNSYKNIAITLPGTTKEMLVTDGEVVSPHSCLGDRKFRTDLKQAVVDSLDAAVTTGGLEEQSLSVTVVYLLDEIQILKCMQQISNQELAAGLIYLDNYDEILESVEEIRRSPLTALIDRKINEYISGTNDVVRKTGKDKYLFAIKQQYMARIQEERFSILEDVKIVNIGNNMAVTLSIGIGTNGDSYSQGYECARASADMALGRGGDQAVVKDSDKIQYYGGKTQQMEKTARVKVRVKAHVLEELMENKGRLPIMGHRLTDIGSFGVAMGIYHIAMSANKKTNIVVNEVTLSMRPMMGRPTRNAEYSEDMLLIGSKAAELADQGTMLVIVGVNRPSITDEPVLLGTVKIVAVLNHHRTSSEIMDNTASPYMEPYASSTCEMVVEVLQYITDGIKIKSAETDAIYADIVVDVQNFTNQVGVRTSEAAAFLRRSGADITRVRRPLRENMKDYQTKADAVRKVEVFMDAFAIGKCPVEGLESPIITGTQVVDELLETRDMRVSVVLTDYSGAIYFSVRSIDEVNVQVMMEKLGGGGHCVIAGAQIQDATVEKVEEQLKDVTRQMMEEGEVS